MEAPILNCFRCMQNSQLSWLTKNSASAEVGACANTSESAKKELALLPDPKGRSIQIVYTEALNGLHGNTSAAKVCSIQVSFQK